MDPFEYLLSHTASFQKRSRLYQGFVKKPVPFSLYTRATEKVFRLVMNCNTVRVSWHFHEFGTIE